MLFRSLAQAVKNSIPAIAEAMEKLRANMIVFRYQLRHIGRGRQRMKDYIHAVQSKLVRYTELVQEIRGKSKERKSLLAEKKETPFYLIPKQHELSRRIAELTEELEDLKSEKDMLLHTLECADDTGITAAKKDIPTLEAALKKLSQQEEKYTAELNDALRQYAELKEQSAEFDPDELQDARLALRPAMERSAVDRVQSAYFLMWICVGLPFGIRRMCLWLVPSGYGISGSVGIFALNLIIGGLIGGLAFFIGLLLGVIHTIREII